MPNDKNKELVKNIKEKITKAKSITFADYKGLTSDQVNTLRQKIKDADGETLVAKNTLMKVAIEESEEKSLKDSKGDLKGPTMTIFGFSDPISPIKALFEFAKNLELPKIKSAIIEGIYRSSDEVEAIKTIPSREELLAKFIGSIHYPVTGFVSALGGIKGKFVFALNAISMKKSNENSEPKGGAN